MATIYYRKDRKRWILQTTINGERKQIGSFKTRAKAQEAAGWLNATIETYRVDFTEVEEPRIITFVKKQVSKWRKRK